MHAGTGRTSRPPTSSRQFRSTTIRPGKPLFPAARPWRSTLITVALEGLAASSLSGNWRGGHMANAARERLANVLGREAAPAASSVQLKTEPDDLHLAPGVSERPRAGVSALPSFVRPLLWSGATKGARPGGGPRNDFRTSGTGTSPPRVATSPHLSNRASSSKKCAHSSG